MVRNQHLPEAVAKRPGAAAAADRQRPGAGKRAGAHAVVEERLTRIVVGDVVDEDFRLGHDLAARLVRVLARPHRDVHRRLDNAIRGDDQLRAAAGEDIDVGVPCDRSRLDVDGLLSRSAAGQRLLAVFPVAVDARDLVGRVDVQRQVVERPGTRGRVARVTQVRVAGGARPGGDERTRLAGVGSRVGDHLGTQRRRGVRLGIQVSE